MRRIIALISLLAIIVALASTSWLMASRSTSAGQGKGGEVIAKPTPTPTPKKTTTNKKLPPRNSKTNQAAKSANDTASAAEMVFWNSIKDSANPNDFKDYLRKYPNGQFAGLAKNRLRALESYSEGLGGGVKLEMVVIPPGQFMMGSADGQGESDEHPQHQVQINYRFHMGKFEVTQAQWRAIMETKPSNFRDCDQCPVVASWNDAKEFCSRLTRALFIWTGLVYRLPSEAEWEYACRAGTTGDYAGDLGSLAWWGPLEGLPHAVGTKQPNGFGLYDMHGNVWEWCEDWYHPDYDGAPADGSAWLTGGEKGRVFRGGSVARGSKFARSAARDWRPPDAPFTPYIYGGFRVVAVVRTQ